MTTFDPALISVLVDQAPAAVGEIAYTTAVDRSRVEREGVLASIRPEMVRIEVPAVLAPHFEHDPEDWLQDEKPTVETFRSPADDFSITFCRYPGEGEIDAYVVVAGVVLHTRNVRGRAFARL